MKKLFRGLLRIKGFRNNYLALTFLAVLFSFIGRGQVFTPIHNAQAQDYLAAVIYFGIPYGDEPALNSTRTVPGALFYNTIDSTLYTWTGERWIPIGGGASAGVRDTVVFQYPLNVIEKLVSGSRFDTARVKGGSPNQVLTTIDSNTVVWADPTGGSGGDTLFADLFDVSLTSLTNNDVAIYKSSSGKWENEPSLRFSLAGLSHGDLFQYDTLTGVWENQPPAVQAASWTLTGNASTTAGTNFVGTTDDMNLMFKRGGVVSGLIDSGSMFRTFFGYKTGNYATSTGIGNSGFGYFALKSNTTGNYNTAVGVQALELNSIGQYSTAVGYQAYGKNTTGLGYGTAIGYQSQFNTTTGNNNLSVGFQSLFTNTTGTENIGIGYQAGYFNSTGTNNTAIGSPALHGNGNFSNNTAVGMNSLYNNTGNNNTAIGFDAVKGNTSGTENVGIGYQAMGTTNPGTGSYNLAMGSLSLFNNTTGALNTALGRNTLFNSTASSNTVALGVQAGQYSFRINDGGNPIDPLQKADSSIFIGNVSTPALDSQTNQIVVGTWNARGLGSHTIMLGDSMNIATGLFGRVSIASTTIAIADASAQLEVSSTTKGFLPPRMTKAQRDAISSPATGLIVWQTDNTPGLRSWNGTNWMRFTETID